MKCPICGKDLDLQNKQIGTSENGDPIFNEYAICHSCKKHRLTFLQPVLG